MLEDAKKSYETLADTYIPGWRNADKNALIREAIKYKHKPIYEGFVSAIMLKYWNKMLAYYHKCKLVATPEDAHSWLVQAVMYALDKHPWTRTDSSIHEDANGPDKVVNRVLESRRCTFYQQLNRYNRKINSALLSLESLSEDWADANTPSIEDEHKIDLDEFVIMCFNCKDYFYAFLLDAIIYEHYSPYKQPKKLVSHLLSIDDDYCKLFACRYDRDLKRVIRASTYITNKSRKIMTDRVKASPRELKHKLKQWGALNVNRTT